MQWNGFVNLGGQEFKNYGSQREPKLSLREVAELLGMSVEEALAILKRDGLMDEVEEVTIDFQDE